MSSTSSFSTWFCNHTAKRSFVKIVHPGGHVELQDRPVPAAEVIDRNPKCCVAHPTVFRRPFDVVSPDTVLVLGKKYYVVPITTVQKLQLHYSQYSAGTRENDDRQQRQGGEHEPGSVCWQFRNSRNGGAAVKNGGVNRLVSAETKQMSEISREEMMNYYGKRSRKENSEVSARLSPGRLSLTSIDNFQRYHLRREITGKYITRD